MNIGFECDMARSIVNQRIDDAALDAHDEIKFRTALAMKQIRRMAEFPARSEGQRRRFAKEKNGLSNATAAKT